MESTKASAEDAATRDVRVGFLVPIVLCLLAALCLAIDLRVAGFFRAKGIPKFFDELFENGETFGHAWGVALIVASIAALDPLRRGWMGTLLLGSWGAGLVADGLKLFITRMRPRTFAELPESVGQTFGDWLPLINRAGGDSHSFPSAHAATAVGFAVVLGAMYPHARWWFYVLAALVGMQRMHCGAHFPSDVCAGAAVGWIIGHAVLGWRRRVRGKAPTVADGGLPNA